ncbi:MAG: hypothetical protein UZ07_CHB004000237 [Chlorobi bacterium OLB7]|nr:MAG: hypothetical protein UZ07_CHB004000237 [Chlorobi bacterium OLB7]
MPTHIPLLRLPQFETSGLREPIDARMIVLRNLSRFTPEHRAILADALLADLHRWNAPPQAIAAAERLRQPNAYAVVTGQQAGLLTGPLYSIYKAMGGGNPGEEAGLSVRPGLLD